MELNDLPLNDLLSQWSNSVEPENYSRNLELRKQEVSKCKHEFVILKARENAHEGPGNHSSDYFTMPEIIECVHCGLSNKLRHVNCSIRMQPGAEQITAIIGYIKPSIELVLFEQEMLKIKDLNYVSKNLLGVTNHAKLLYDIAIDINPDCSNEETFNIMQTLSSIETGQEQLRLANISEAKELIKRYYEQKKRKLEIIK